VPDDPFYLNHINILLVEDDQDDQEIMREMFEEMDRVAVITIFSSPDEFIDYLEKLKKGPLPDLIVLDYNLPELTAEEVLLLVRKHERFNYLPVVVYSSTMTEEKELDLKTLGADFCRVKPSSLEGLRSLVTELIDYADTHRSATHY
jgi:CheY-like chemotaxis protein